VVEIKCKDNLMGLVELEGGLIITPKHPVLIKGVWYKPKELGEI